MALLPWSRSFRSIGRQSTAPSELCSCSFRSPSLKVFITKNAHKNNHIKRYGMRPVAVRGSRNYFVWQDSGGSRVQFLEFLQHSVCTGTLYSVLIARTQGADLIATELQLRRRLRRARCGSPAGAPVPGHCGLTSRTTRPLVTGRPSPGSAAYVGWSRGRD